MSTPIPFEERNHIRDIEAARSAIRAALEEAQFKHPQFERVLARKYLIGNPKLEDRFLRQNWEGKRLNYELLSVRLDDDVAGMSQKRIVFHRAFYLIMQDATNLKPTVVRVPPNVRTCREALAWTFGFDDPDDYFPMVET